MCAQTVWKLGRKERAVGIVMLAVLIWMLTIKTNIRVRHETNRSSSRQRSLWNTSKCGAADHIHTCGHVNINLKMQGHIFMLSDFYQRVYIPPPLHSVHVEFFPLLLHRCIERVFEFPLYDPIIFRQAIGFGYSPNYWHLVFNSVDDRRLLTGRAKWKWDEKQNRNNRASIALILVIRLRVEFVSISIVIIYCFPMTTIAKTTSLPAKGQKERR